MVVDVEGDVYVLVEYFFEYIGKDGCCVVIWFNECYWLLWCSIEYWWYVWCEFGGCFFYLFVQYVCELFVLGNFVVVLLLGFYLGFVVFELLVYDYWFVSVVVVVGFDGVFVEF